jgi:hypothetical protein
MKHPKPKPARKRKNTAHRQILKLRADALRALKALEQPEPEKAPRRD